MPCSARISHGLADHALGGSPADQRNLGIPWAPQFRRRNGGSIPAIFRMRFSIMARRLMRVGELVADQHAVFVVLVGGDGVDVARNARNGARRDAAVGDLVAFVRAACRSSRTMPMWSISSPRSIGTSKSRSFGSTLEPAFRQQQIAQHDTRALEAVGQIEHLGDGLEAVSNVGAPR